MATDLFTDFHHGLLSSRHLFDLSWPGSPEGDGIQCPRCQHENPPQAKFCLECATPLALRCANCGTQLPAGAKFCFECATPVSIPSSAPRFASAETYTPKHLAERIINSKTALEGERKQVTVLFADLKGSMELLADRDPEEARKLLDPVLEHMMEAVHRYEGTVNQVMGDGIMALFGAPLAHEDHAVRACYAALRLQVSVGRYAEGMRRQEGITVRIRVGLNSGEVVVRAIGSDLHMDYTAVGQTTHLAARMEQLADPGTVLLTSATLTLAEDFIQVRPQGPTPVKGLSEPVEVYELVGANPVRSRFHAHAARGLTAFVGRGSEMAQLSEAHDLTRRGRGQVVAVVGEPGVGKSRLCWEFNRSHRTSGWLVLESASVSYGKATTYLPVIELLRGYFQIAPRDDTRNVREKVTGKLLSLDRSLELAVPPLFALLDVPLGDDEWTRLDPAQRRHRIVDALKRVLLCESQMQPVVVVFEDLHWIDGETQAVLDGLVESLPTARVLLLVNYRPEYRHSWNSKTYYRQLRIDPLPAVSASDLLRSLLGTDPSLDPLERLLIERTDGNPLFLEESVRTLAETRVLVGAAGAYRLTRAPETLEIPATAQAIIAARVDRLEPEDKRLLQAASVLGKDVPLVLLEAIADIREDDLRQRLAGLQAAEFLYEARLFPEVEYTFKHALTHEVAYASLLQERRRQLHARIVGAIETLYADHLIEHVDRLAHHAFAGEQWPAAVRYLRDAGHRSQGRSFRQAVTYFERALEAWRHVPQTREARKQAIDVILDLRGPLFALGEYDRVGEYLREAKGLADALGDARQLAWVLAFMSHNLWNIGHSAESIAVADRTREIADTLGDWELQTIASYNLGRACLNAGDFRGVERHMRRVTAGCEGDRRLQWLGPAGFVAANARSWLLMALAATGRFDEGIAEGRTGARIAEELAHPYTQVQMARALATLYLKRGALAEAQHLLDQYVSLSREWELRALSASLQSLLGRLRALSGFPVEGLALMEQVPTARFGPGAGQESRIYIGEAYVLLGRLEEAGTVAERALASARDQDYRPDEASALRLVGDIIAAAERPAVDDAAARYREALALADELGMGPLVAHCHLGLGKLYRRAGKREQAQEHLTTATTMYRDMEMQFWLDQAEAEMREIR